MASVVAECVRREKSLLLFPLASTATGLALVGGVYWAALGMMSHTEEMGGFVAEHLLAFFLIQLGLFLLLLFVFALVTAFWSFTLTHAALNALNDQRVSVLASVGAGLRRRGDIFRYALLALGGGAFMSIAGGFSWHLVTLLAMPAMVREKRRAKDAVLRGVELLQLRWADGQLTTPWQFLLWLPIVVSLAITLRPAPEVDLGTPAAVFACAATFVPLVTTLYGAALYVLATEGVVPGTLGRALDLATTTAPRPRRNVVAYAVIGLSIAFAVIGVGRSIRGVLPEDASTDTTGWGHRWTKLWGVRIPEGAWHLTANAGSALVVGDERFYAVSAHGKLTTVTEHPFKGSVNLLVCTGEGRCAGDASERYGVHTVRAFVGHKQQWWNFGWSDVTGLSPLAADWAVGFDKRLCLYDSASETKWCVDDAAGPSVAIDCDNDGHNDVIATMAGQHPRLGCYSAAGERISEHAAPRRPMLLEAHDLNGDGTRELLVLTRELGVSTLGIGAETARYCVRSASTASYTTPN